MILDQLNSISAAINNTAEKSVLPTKNIFDFNYLKCIKQPTYDSQAARHF